MEKIYIVRKNAEAIKEMMDDCRSLLIRSIKKVMDPETIADWDSDTLELYHDTMELFESSCETSISMAKQLDEQSEILMRLTNEMEVLEKQNEEILRIVKK